MKIVNASCAGIDVGSRSHYVAIGQQDKDVREFGVYAEDLRTLCTWLKEHQITSAALESTGTYWQNLYVELINSGIEVVLTSGRFIEKHEPKKYRCKRLPVNTETAFAGFMFIELPAR